MVLADRADRKGEEIFKRFKVDATPTVLFVDGDGAEVDWHVGYGPPPEKFHAKVENTAKGVDTFKSLSALYAQSPNKVDVVYKLAKKYDDRFSAQDKAKALYQEVLVLDPGGKLGSTETRDGEKVSYTEMAEFALGQMAIFSRGNQDPAPMKAFLAKYPQSKLLENAYQYLGYYYMNQPKDTAIPFYEEYVAKFSDKPYALSSYVEFLVRTRSNPDRGLELAKAIEKLTRFNPVPSFRQNEADLLFLKDDKAKALEVYGKDFMEDKVTSLGYDLVDYADFWAKKKDNTESALKMVETALKIAPDNAYLLSRAAGVYCALDKKDLALSVFGEAYAKKNWDKPNALATYARFWANQGAEPRERPGRGSQGQREDAVRLRLGHRLHHLPQVEEVRRGDQGGRGGDQARRRPGRLFQAEAGPHQEGSRGREKSGREEIAALFIFTIGRPEATLRPRPGFLNSGIFKPYILVC
jgi:tetratricopeptide (TPR) repeat protein